MESPNKRPRPSSTAFDSQEDFVALGVDEIGKYSKSPSTGDAGPSHRQPQSSHYRGRSAWASSHPHDGHHRSSNFRNTDDRPKSKHTLPGYEPWILVRTKLRRHFVHNLETKESLWRIPQHVAPGVAEFEAWEQGQKEKVENARWAEEQYKQMQEQDRVKREAAKINDAGERSTRRRSESLQREDEEALMAELAAEAERNATDTGEAEAGAKQETATPLHHPTTGYDSEGSYEEVEVTDSEHEDGEVDEANEVEHGASAQSGEANGAGREQANMPPKEDATIEFGEDDIAYQLAAMEEDYDYDQDKADDDLGGERENWDDEPAINDEDAVNIFRELLDHHQISPFTPWDRIISDESSTSLLLDDRYTALPTMRARKEVFDAWVRDKAAQIQQERAMMEKRDPRIPYLVFLHEQVISSKLYWPEFKRKFKRDPAMTDRQLSDKDREKLYREHVSRLKLPEVTRKADLVALLSRVSLQSLHRGSNPATLPEEVLSHVHSISLPASVRDAVVAAHLRTLPPLPKEA